MTGISSAFWSALAGICQFFAALALSRSEWWVKRAEACHRRAAS